MLDGRGVALWHVAMVAVAVLAIILAQSDLVLAGIVWFLLTLMLMAFRPR